MFTVHFGPKKVVVLASHKTVKEALVGKAEEFGDRDVTPLFHDISQGHGTCTHLYAAVLTGEVGHLSFFLVFINVFVIHK